MVVIALVHYYTSWHSQQLSPNQQQQLSVLPTGKSWSSCKSVRRLQWREVRWGTDCFPALVGKSDISSPRKAFRC